MNFKKYFFWIVVIVQAAAIILGIDLLDKICRSILMVALLVYFWDQTDDIKEAKWVRYTTLAIAFSWIGDIMFVLFDKNFIFFFFGLSAFIAAHIFYILAFRRATINKETPIKFSLVPILAIGYFIVMGYLILPYVDGVVQVPISIYALSLLVMVIFAWYRKDQSSAISFQMIFAGVLLFVISDSVLVINRFSISIPYAQYASLAFYIFAQWLVVTGLIKHRALETVA